MREEVVSLVNFLGLNVYQRDGATSTTKMADLWMFPCAEIFFKKKSFPAVLPGEDSYDF